MLGLFERLPDEGDCVCVGLLCEEVQSEQLTDIVLRIG